MRSLLRDPGAEVVVGLLSFSASFVGIGLAIAALVKGGALLRYAYGAWTMAIILFIVALIAVILLSRHLAKTKGYIRQTGRFMRQGYKLRQEMLNIKEPSVFTEELAQRLRQWEEDVQQWLDLNLPDYAPDFNLETITSTTSYYFYDGVTWDVSTATLRLESRLTNLREILRDIRM
ncbi:hypothetical protein ACFLX1_01870 [Chloroflexota bacterium]